VSPVSILGGGAGAAAGGVPPGAGALVAGGASVVPCAIAPLATRPRIIHATMPDTSNRLTMTRCRKIVFISISFTRVKKRAPLFSEWRPCHDVGTDFKSVPIAGSAPTPSSSLEAQRWASGKRYASSVTVRSEPDPEITRRSTGKTHTDAAGSALDRSPSRACTRSRCR
jgi:hypothetical protein